MAKPSTLPSTTSSRALSSSAVRQMQQQPSSSMMGSTNNTLQQQHSIPSQLQSIPNSSSVLKPLTPSSSIPSTSSSTSEEEEKIFMALSTCYDDYLQGNKILMSRIVNEMSNRHKDKEHIRLWLKACTKKVIDVFRKKQDPSYLIEVMLYSMPWFEAGNEYEVGLRMEELRKQEQIRAAAAAAEPPSPSPSMQQLQIGSSTSLFSTCSTTKKSGIASSSCSAAVTQLQIIKPSPHFELFPELSKFLMTILSFSNSFAPQIFKFLVSNIVPIQIKEMEGCKKSEIEISVEGNVFENQKKLLMHIRDLLSQYRLDSVSDTQELNKEDSAFMLGVLKFHPSAKEKMNRFKKLLIGQAQFDDKISRCLYISNKDGVKVDISYVKSVQNLVDEEFQKINLKQQGSPNQKRMMAQLVDQLVRIMKIYPLYQNDLCRILAEFYPHRVQGELFHKIYLTNVLSLAIKCPIIQSKILLFVVQKLLEIDSEIKLDHSAETDIQSSSKMSQIMAEKLDWLMLIIFEFIDYLMHDKVGTDTCFGEITAVKYTSSSEQESSESAIFKMFLNVFSEQILLTHQSKYVQFMLFYLCSLRRSFEKTFLNYLMTNITKKNPTLYKSTQINSIYYLGSYLARAKYVSHESIVKIFEFLLSHLRNYIEKFDERQKEVNYNEGLHRIHQNLYHLLQAIMYVMCFRFNAIADTQANLILQTFFDILRQACDNFNALVFISPSIQNVFLDVCEIFNENEFTEIYENNQLQHPQSASDQAQLNRAIALESYFPFDPYCLQYSDKYICEIYQNWQEYQNNQQLDTSIHQSQEYIKKQKSNLSTESLQQSSTLLSKKKRSKEQSEEQSNLLHSSNNNLNLSMHLSRENGQTISNNNLNMSRSYDNYGFTIDKLNHINDLQYDRDNMLSEDDNVPAVPLKRKSSSKRIVEIDNFNPLKILESSHSKQANTQPNGSNSSGQRMSSKHNRNPISTTDNSANHTPITHMDDFPSPVNLASMTEGLSKLAKKRKHANAFGEKGNSGAGEVGQNNGSNDSILSDGENLSRNRSDSSNSSSNSNNNDAHNYSFGNKKLKKNTNYC